MNADEFFAITNTLSDIYYGLGTLQKNIYGCTIVLSIIGIAILWNQRKIKKMLREMQEKEK